MQSTPRWVRVVTAVLPLALLVACSSSSTGDASADADAADVSTVDAGTPVARWVLPHGVPNRFQLPWPSDLALTPEGFADLRYLVSPMQLPIATVYIDAVAGRLRGFSPNGSVYFLFSEAVDTATMHANATEPGGVALINIDPDSPERGQRVDADVAFRADSVPLMPANGLVLGPRWGTVLRRRTRYAAVVLRGLRATTGAAFVRDADLERVLALDATNADADTLAARAVHTPALVELERAGVARDQILSLAVFTTNDPTDELTRAARANAALPAPTVRDVAADAMLSTDTRAVYTGHFGPNPVFQRGDPPYAVSPSGDLEFDATGTPRVQRMIDIRFVLAVPRGDAPASGWPLVVYAQGTGGAAADFLRPNETVTAALLQRGIAVLSYDQVFIGERATSPTGDATIDGLGPGGPFYNYTNPYAGRMNSVQSAMDLLNATRFVRALRIPAETAVDAREARFDAAKLSFFGHSQGSLTGPLALAVDDTLRAAMFSGAGGTLVITILQRRTPQDIRARFAMIAGLSGVSQLFPRHPVLMLAQTASDVADPVNYARDLVLEPRAGLRPHHVYVTEGLIDRASPPDTCLALSRAMGLPMVGPMSRDELTFNYVAATTLAPPVRGNAAMNTVTAGVRQYRVSGDGHFAVFNLAAATTSVADYFATAVSDPAGVPTIR